MTKAQSWNGTNEPMKFWMAAPGSFSAVTARAKRRPARRPIAPIGSDSAMRHHGACTRRAAATPYSAPAASATTMALRNPGYRREHPKSVTPHWPGLKSSRSSSTNPAALTNGIASASPKAIATSA